MSETGQVVYNRTYSRTKPDGTKETWPETVERVVDGNLALVDARHQLPGERDDLIRMMTEFEIIPAGRHLWATGVKNAGHIMNCWASGWADTPSDHFQFTFMRLMEGGGVGANYSNYHLEKYPPVVHPLRVEIVCDPGHPDYQEMFDAGVLSEHYSPDWGGAFIIEDSREGWAAALVDLIDTHYRDETVHYQRVYDVSRIRPAGAKLKTFGGQASGPLPFAQMLQKVCKILSDKAGGQLSGMDCMDLDHAIAQCVVAGGVRRSARMAMMHWADPQIEQFINCKSESGDHWTTNISVEVDSWFWGSVNSDADLPDDQAYSPGVHARKVLKALAEGAVRNGEPGMWDSSLSNVGEPNAIYTTNPCMSKDTWVQTANGPRKIADLIGVPFVAVVDGKPYNSTPEGFFRTGYKDLYRLETEEGWTAEVTALHEVYSDGQRVKVQDLKPGDKIRLSDHRSAVPWEGRGSLTEGYALGWLIGDGTFGPHAILQSQGKPATQTSRDVMEAFVKSLPHRADFSGWAGPYATGQLRLCTKAFSERAAEWGIVKGNKTITDEVERGSWEFYRGLLRGLFDTDGHVEYSKTSGVSVRLSSADRDLLVRAQRMLGRLGVRSSVRGMHQEKRMTCPNTGNEYTAAPSYRLLITNRLNVIRFQDVVGFWHEDKQNQLKDGIEAYGAERETVFEATFKAAEFLRTEDVYDCTIDVVYDFCGNGFYMRDCGEITLEAWEPCNLGHVNLAAFVDPTDGYVDFQGLRYAHILMTRFLIRATFSEVADPKSREVLDRNRRIGVGHLGVASFLAMTNTRYSQAPHDWEFTDRLGSWAVTVNNAARDFCHDLRIPVPVKLRTIAPTGTVAKMPGVSEGIHPIFSKYFVRRIRFNKLSDAEALQRLVEQGYEVEDDLFAPNTAVVSIPTKDGLVEAVEGLYGTDECIEAADDLTLGQLFDMQALYQGTWADNAVSFTANVDPEAYTAEDVAATLRSFGGKLKGSTIFPEASFPQAPYERITREQYEASVIREIGDGVDEECSSGACPIR